jgi:hypothetical protein
MLKGSLKNAAEGVSQKVKEAKQHMRKQEIEAK